MVARRDFFRSIDFMQSDFYQIISLATCVRLNRLFSSLNSISAFTQFSVVQLVWQTDMILSATMILIAYAHTLVFCIHKAITRARPRALIAHIYHSLYRYVYIDIVLDSLRILNGLPANSKFSSFVARVKIVTEMKSQNSIRKDKMKANIGAFIEYIVGRAVWMSEETNTIETAFVPPPLQPTEREHIY